MLPPSDAPRSRACLLPPAAGRCGVGKEAGLPADGFAFLPSAGTAHSLALAGGVTGNAYFCV